MVANDLASKRRCYLIMSGTRKTAFVLQNWRQMESNRSCFKVGQFWCLQRFAWLQVATKICLATTSGFTPLLRLHPTTEASPECRDFVRILGLSLIHI